MASTNEELAQLEFCRAVFQETLRLRGASAFQFFNCLVCMIRPCGLLFKKKKTSHCHDRTILFLGGSHVVSRKTKTTAAIIFLAGAYKLILQLPGMYWCYKTYFVFGTPMYSEKKNPTTPTAVYIYLSGRLRNTKGVQQASST